MHTGSWENAPNMALHRLPLAEIRLLRSETSAR